MESTSLTASCLRLCDVAGEQQLANTRDCRGGFGIVAVAIGLAVPDGLLVQLEAIQTGHTEDHRAEPPIADWKRVRPLRCGLREVQCACAESSFRVSLERVQAGDDAASLMSAVAAAVPERKFRLVILGL